MKLLKIKVDGLPLFAEETEIDFCARQRVASDDKENLYCLFSNIYLNKAVSFIGINASGKTTVLKMVSFVLNLMNNEPMNHIDSRDILYGSEEVVFEIFFTCRDDVIHKLRTVIRPAQNNREDGCRFKIEEEKIWEKPIRKVKTKKGLFAFEDLEPILVRDKAEEFLMDDVSIMIAFNKKNRVDFLVRDMSRYTNINILSLFGDFPSELISFLDPGIEYLRCKMEKEEVEIHLKFKGKKEMILNNPIRLDQYLSSGTIKGLAVFMNAMFVFQDAGYLIVDELENHFNREMAATLVRFFMDETVNPKGATLVFSTHYPELLDEFERNDSIYITRNENGITVDNLANILKRNDIKKSEAYQSGFLGGTAPLYEAYIALKREIISGVSEEEPA